VSDQPTPDRSVPPPTASFAPPVTNPARFVAAPAPVQTASVPATKSATTAVLLSLLIIGAGHWYTGEVGRGFAFLGAAVLAAFTVVYVIGIVALPVVGIWAVIDAAKSAERQNARLAAGL
jgi:TM2 domain-containing membrane protein YozV